MRHLPEIVVGLVLCLAVALNSSIVWGAELAGRYQLIVAQYEDKQGNVHPMVYRIDTQTGVTHYLEWTVQTVDTYSIRFPYFGEVRENLIPQPKDKTIK